MHRQKVRLVAQLGDQRQLALDGDADLRRHALRPALAGTLFRQVAQMARRRFALRHQLVRILVPQLIQRESTLGRDRQRLFEQLTRIQPFETFAFAQIALAIGMEIPSAFRDRHAQTNSRQHVLQLAALAHVHMNVAAGNEQQIEITAYLFEDSEAFTVSSVAQQLDGYPHSSLEMLREPAGFVGLEVAPRRPPRRGQPQERALPETVLLDVLTGEAVAAFIRGTPSSGDETTQLAITTAIDRQSDEP